MQHNSIKSLIRALKHAVLRVTRHDDASRHDGAKKASASLCKELACLPPRFELCLALLARCFPKTTAPQARAPREAPGQALARPRPEPRLARAPPRSRARLLALHSSVAGARREEAGRPRGLLALRDCARGLRP